MILDNLNHFDSAMGVLGAPILRRGKWKFDLCLRGLEGTESILGVYFERFLVY